MAKICFLTKINSKDLKECGHSGIADVLVCKIENSSRFVKKKYSTVNVIFYELFSGKLE